MGGDAQMDARELLRAGDPHGALEQLKREVRKAPRDVRLRTFLFQLFCVFGEWDRAITQLVAASELDPAAVPMAQTYRTAIRCEVLRARVFAGTRTPTVFGEPEPWMPLLVEANRLLAAGHPAEAERMREEAFEQAPAAAGTLNGAPFEWIADADPRFGPMLEAVVDGRYWWVPFHRLRTLEVEAPADLRDQIWMPTRFVWSNGGEGFGFVPTRYPGLEADADTSLLLSHRTEWQEHDGWFLGRGQRMLATDAGETALMDVRRIEFPPETAGDAGT
jgi:type VI secretion system protein ImpE